MKIKSLQKRNFVLVILLFLSGMVFGQLGGTYTVDSSKAASSSNYKDLASAISDLNLGKRTDGGSINGPGVKSAVVIKLSDQTYFGQFRIGNISGTSLSNTVEFTSASGDSSKVILNSSISSLTNSFTLQLDSADHVTFSKITIERTGVYGTLTNGRVIWLTNGADSISIKNCRITGTTGTTTTSTRALIYNYYNTIKNNNFSLENCYLKNGAYQLYNYGSFSSHAYNLNITNNTFDSTSGYAIYSYYYDNLKIVGNIVQNNTTGMIGGMYLNYCDTSFTISKNKININSGTYGLYLWYMNIAGTGRSSIDNNMISTSGATYGLYFYNTANTDIVYNSFYTLSSTGECFYANTFSTRTYNNNIYNNNFYFPSKGGLAINLGTGVATYGMIDSMEYNNIYSGGTNLASYNGTLYSTLSAYQAASGLDANSISSTVNYASANDLHTFSPSLNGKASPFLGFSKDIDGDIRNTSTPDIGADEFTPLSDDISILSILQPQDGDCGDSNTSIKLVLSNNGSASKSVLPVKVEIDNGSTITTLSDSLLKTVASGNQDTITLSNKLNTFAGGTFKIKAFTTLSSDQYRNNDTVSITVIIKPSPTRPTGVKGASRCGYGTLVLRADTAGKGSSNLWYTSLTSTTPVAKGDTFITPKIGSSTTYYVAKGNYSSTSIGEKTNTFSTAGGYNTGNALNFDTYKPITIDSLTVYPTSSGKVVIRIDNSSGTVISTDTIPVTVSTSGTAVRIGTKLKVPNAGTGYAMYGNLLVTSGTPGLYRNTSGSKFTSTVSTAYSIPGVMRLTKTGNSLAGYYYYFYNIKVTESSCPSQKVAVIATITTGVKPTAKFSVKSTCYPGSVQFTDSSKAATGYTISSWNYELNPDTTISSTSTGSLSYAYKKAGTYTALLTVTGSNGCADTISKTFVYDQKPVAGFFSTGGCSGNSISFLNNGTPISSLSNIFYDFGDTSTANTTNASYSKTYKYGKTYTVKQVITTTTGCKDSLTDSLVIAQTPNFPVANDVISCNTGSFKLIASKTFAPNKNNWYKTMFSDSIIYIGDTLTTPLLSSSDTYYVEAGANFYSSVGKKSKTTGTGGNYTFYSDGLVFEALQDFTLDSLTVYPSAKGDVVVNIIDSSTGTTAYTTTVTVAPSTANAAVRIPIGFKILTGKYSINATGTTTGGLYRNTSSASYPYTDGKALSITRAINSLTNYYYFFFDWKISQPGCPSGRKKVVVRIGSGAKPKAKFSTKETCVKTLTSIVDSSSIASTNKLVKWEYAYSDSTLYSSTTSGNHQKSFNYSGVKKVTLTVTSDSGCADTTSRFIKVNKNPVANFNNSNPYCVDGNISFTPNVILNSASPIVKYFWIFGNKDTSSAKNATTTFKSATSFSNTLVVMNSLGCLDSVTNILAINPKPNIGFKIQNSCENALNILNDTSNISKGSIAKRTWQVTATKSDTGKIVSYKFGKAGSYSVRLLVESDRGCKDSLIQSVKVLALPTSKFTYIVGTGTRKVTFNPSNTGLKSYNWAFGESSATDTGASVNHTYAADGNFKVTLAITDINGCSNTFDSTIAVIKTAIYENSVSIGAVKLYPNPATEQINISIDLIKSTQIKMEILSTEGKIISNIYNGNSINKSFNINKDISWLSAGLYFIRISTLDGVKNLPFNVVR